MWKILFIISKNTLLLVEMVYIWFPNQRLMENYYLPELNAIGQKHVESWLNENGYSDITKELFQSNDYGFIAKGSIESLVVQIRTFLHPQRPFKLSDFEVDLLTARAAKLGIVAYAAYVIVDGENNLAEEIIWERLS
jgi:hypothetical protein